VDLTPVIDEIMLGGLPLEESCAQNIDLSGRKIPSLIVWNSHFDHVSFASCEISSFRLRDVRLVKCDLSNAILRGFEASRVEFIECRLIGMRAIECHWQDVLVENCDMRYAQLNDGKARSCEFRASTWKNRTLGHRPRRRYFYQCDASASRSQQGKTPRR